MSKNDMWAVIGRGKDDIDFGTQLLDDFEKTVKAAGYNLDQDEIRYARDALSGSMPPPPPHAPFPMISTEDLRFQSDKMKERLTAHVKRLNDLGEYTVMILKNTLNNAAAAYKTITWMNIAMFALGFGLFLFAAIYSAVAQEKMYALIFGGLGAGTFIALFMLGPIEKTQRALSNLVQVEIAFLNYFEQITFWEAYALTPKGNPPSLDPQNIVKASQALQERSEETMHLLQIYIEEPSTKASKRPRRYKKEEASEQS